MVSENMSIKDRILAVRERMASSAERAGRRVSEIALMGVTKTRTVEEMLEAVPLLDCLGENRVQEAESKRQAWPSGIDIEWRLIGHLQGNKVRRALSLFDTLDSLDSVDLALTVERIASELNRTVPVLIEVNTSGEASKTGLDLPDFPALLDCVAGCARLKLQGLMTMGPLTDDEAQVRKAFASLRELAGEAGKKTGLSLPVLSMGMSGDFEWAILEGSTMVRVGTSLFGAR